MNWPNSLASNSTQPTRLNSIEPNTIQFHYPRRLEKIQLTRHSYVNFNQFAAVRSIMTTARHELRPQPRRQPRASGSAAVPPARQKLMTKVMRRGTAALCSSRARQQDDNPFAVGSLWQLRQPRDTAALWLQGRCWLCGQGLRENLKRASAQQVAACNNQGQLATL